MTAPATASATTSRRSPPRRTAAGSTAAGPSVSLQGLCYSCDEPFVCGHQCKRLFYLESGDFANNDDTPRPRGDRGGHGSTLGRDC
jgi:hypothetical protein